MGDSGDSGRCASIGFMAGYDERENDLRLLKQAAEGMAELANMELSEDSLGGEEFRAYCKVKIQAAQALVPLLERRAKLLGLDARPDAPQTGTETPVERMSRELLERAGRS